MKVPELQRLSRPFPFVLLALLLGISVLYSRVIRRGSFVAELQYVPKENTLLLATGGIESLWQAVDAHFGRVIQEGERDGFLSSLVKDLREHFKDQEVPVSGLADLARYGLDLRRGALFSLHSVGSASGSLFLLHLQQQEAFNKFFTQLLDLEPDEEPVELRGSKDEAFQITSFDKPDVYLTYPQPGLAVISDSSDLLQRSLFSRKTNFAHALESDALYEGIRQRLRRPFLSGPALFLFWKPQDIPLIRQVVTVVNFGRETISLEADVEFIKYQTKSFLTQSWYNTSSTSNRFSWCIPHDLMR